MSRRKLIIDTDCGLDDAQAILMALSQPNVQIMAITTTYGNASVDQVCRNVLRVLQVADRLDVPVFKGTAKSLLQDSPEPTAYHGLDGLGDVPDPNPLSLELIQKEHGVNAIVRIVNENPGEVSLVCLAPLTNIAMAIKMDPDIGEKLKECHIMGGNYEAKGNLTVTAEFNFRSDPEAAYIVLKEIGCSITLVCWELCTKYHLTWDEYTKLRENSTKISKFLEQAEKALVDYSRKENWPYLPCDEIAMAVAMERTIVTNSADVCCTVELKGSVTRGQMVVDWRGLLKQSKNVNLVQEIDRERYYKLMLQIVKN